MNRLVLNLIRLYLRGLARVVPGTAGRQAFRLFSTPRRRASVPSAVEALMSRSEGFDVDSGGLRIAAYRWRSTGETDRAQGAPRVMLVHGWESRAARLAVWVEPLLAAGFEVVAFDGPAHGDSAGRRANPMVFARAMGAVVERTGPVTACVGHSMGGLAALLTICGGRLLGQEALEMERLVLLAGADSSVDAMTMFCDILGLGEGFPHRGTNGTFLPLLMAGAAEVAEGIGGHQVTDFDAHRLFVDYPVPTLWLHDPEDAEVPFEAAERVARVCPHVTLEPANGLGHHHIARDPAMIRRGLEFLSSVAA